MDEDYKVEAGGFKFAVASDIDKQIKSFKINFNKALVFGGFNVIPIY